MKRPSMRDRLLELEAQVAQQARQLAEETERRQSAESALQASESKLRGLAVSGSTGAAVTERLETEIQRRLSAEQALRDSAAKLTRLWESNVIGLGLSDVNGRILGGNEAYSRILGRTQQEVNSGALRWPDITPPEWLDTGDRAAAQQLRETGVAEEYEKEYLRPDGSRVRVLLGIALLEGSQTDVILFCLDITRRHQAEDALASLNRELEQRVVERTARLAESETRTAEAHQALAVSEGQLRALTARLQAVREEERTRLAREIHDVLGQELTGLKIDAAWSLRRVREVSPGHEVAARLEAMCTRIEGSMHTVRRIALDLRPGVLDDLGLRAALEWQAEDFEGRYGVAVTCELPAEDPAVTRETATELFRMFQELLTNVARHAQAARAELRLAQQDGMLIMTVQDDGRGIRLHEISGGHSLGLLGLRERARQLGGTVEIGAPAGGGTRVEIRIPLS